MSARIDITPGQLDIVQDILKEHLPKGTLAWAFGSRVTWAAKPFSDLDIALEGAAPLPADVLINLEEASEQSDLPWKVDVVDLNAVSPEFRVIVEAQRVPVGWEEVELRKVADLLSSDRGISVGVMYPGGDTVDGVPLIRAGDIKDGIINPSIKFRISKKVHEEYSRTKLVGGEILITLVGNPGIVAIVPPEMNGWNAARAVAVVRLKNPAENGFFRAALSTPSVQHTIRNVCNTTVQATLNLRDIKALELPWPQKYLREQIAKVVAMFDDKIELNRRMNETLEAMARAVFRDWFIDFGPTRRKAAGITDPAAILGGLLPNLTQAAELVDLFAGSFEAGGLPEGWEERPFVSFLDIIGGGTPKTKVPEYWGGEVPWFSVVDTPPKGSVFAWSTEKTITERGVAESSVRIIEAGTTIITARGTVGNIAMAASPMTFNQSCYALRAVEPVGDIFVYLATERMVERLKAMAHGSVFSTITRSTFDSLNFAWADEDVFSAFEKLAEPMFKLIKANGQENQSLAATRDLLLPKLMSGEIRLKDMEGEV